jgi:transcriptional regulator with XRE-family HTH domain
LEAGRIERGLSYADLGRAVGLSGQQVARICRGQSNSVSIVRVSTLLAAVGLDLSARAYPGGAPVRDQAHLALLARLRNRIPKTLRWRVEVPVVQRYGERQSIGAPATFDQRAWDAMIDGADWRLGVEAETRLGDIQALERRLALKERDGDVTAVILLLNDTAHNRRIVADEGSGLRGHFPGGAREALRLLGAGRPPVSSTILVL